LCFRQDWLVTGWGKEKMNVWRLVAIIFIVLFVLETSFFILGAVIIAKEEEMYAICYYDVCEDYPQADLDLTTSLCGCYDYDLMDNPILVKTTYMKTYSK